MFKFNFQEEEHSSKNSNLPGIAVDLEEDLVKEAVDSQENVVKEAVGKEIVVSDLHGERATVFPQCIVPLVGGNFKLVDCKHVEQILAKEQAEGDDETGLRTAIQLNSDVIRGVYEGGLKIWECTLDLICYFNENRISFDSLKVLDLGCGAGLLGIHALRNGASSVHFQDYNHEVVNYITIPNVKLNCDVGDLEKPCRYFSGDWGSLHDLLDRYDTLLTSETIYNPDNYSKLLALFDRVLKPNGCIYLAAKTQYFGVGGNLRQFEKLIADQKMWTIQTCFCSEEGVRREIIKISRSG